MHISFCCSDTDAQPWLDALRAALPGANITEWAPGAPAADYAVVWRPPQAFFDDQPRLRAIFNTGAGIDALKRLRLPEGVPLIRLEDAGMAVQMAEYVALRYGIVTIDPGRPVVEQRALAERPQVMRAQVARWYESAYAKGSIDLGHMPAAPTPRLAVTADGAPVPEW